VEFVRDGRAVASAVRLTSLLLLVEFALQSVFVPMRGTNPEVAALHPLNGAIMLVVAFVLARSAWRAYLVPDGLGG
jgi:hypothetical protein